MGGGTACLSEAFSYCVVFRWLLAVLEHSRSLGNIGFSPSRVYKTEISKSTEAIQDKSLVNQTAHQQGVCLLSRFSELKAL